MSVWNVNRKEDFKIVKSHNAIGRMIPRKKSENLSNKIDQIYDYAQEYHYNSYRNIFNIQVNKLTHFHGKFDQFIL